MDQVRPMNLPKAQPLNRGFAWFFDFMLFALLVALFSGPVEIFSRFLEDRPVLNWIAAMLVFGGPLLIAATQAIFRTTPGKKFLQVRIVDDHGLSPGPVRLAVRSIAQFSFLWYACIMRVFEVYEWDVEGLAIVGMSILGVAHLISAILATFSRRGRTLHDMLLRTRVCLDAGSIRVQE